MSSPYSSGYGLLQHVDRTLNRETQYNFDEPFDKKQYNTAMITGHRWLKYNNPEVDNLITMAVNLGVTHFLCGMALGVDQDAAQVLISRGLKWTAVIPCADQDKLWKPRQRSHYKKLLEKATKQVILYPEYSSGVMHARNLWMVKHADICLALLNDDPHKVGGGTATTVQMAIDRNLLIFRFNPSDSGYSMIEPPWKQMSLFIND